MSVYFVHRTEKGDAFLWDTIVYIKRYLVIKELESDKNLKMPGYHTSMYLFNFC